MDVKIAAKDGRREVLEIYVDDDLWRTAHRHILGRKPSLPKEIASLDDLETKFAAAELSGTRRYALYRLTRRSHGSAELAAALRERLVSEAVIERVLESFTSAGYLDDASYLQRLVNAEWSRGRGPATIRVKLRKKGFDADVIDEALSSLSRSDEEVESVAKLLKTRYGKRDLKDSRERQKVIASIMRRGFSFDAVRQALEAAKVR